MRDRLLSGRKKEFLIAFAAGAAMLLASLANFLSFNNYPYFRPEVGVIVAGMVAFAAFIAAWYVPQRQWGRSFLEGLLAALFVDLNTDSIPMIVGVGLTVAAVSYWRRLSLLAPMAILGTVVLVTTLGGIGGRSSWISTAKGKALGETARVAGKPAILHIILDEHIGLEGVASEGPDGLKLRDELRSAYQAAGFSVFGGAYSQHYHSANSIPYILNYGKGLGQIVDRRGVEIGPTRHLQSLVDQGYRLRILQSDYADVCTGANYFECTTYDSSSLRPTLDIKMSIGNRTELIFYKFLKLSDIFTLLSEGWNLWAIAAIDAGVRIPVYNTSPGHSSSVASLQAFDRLTGQLKSAKSGDAYFAHLLFPHHPYVVGPDCRFVERPWQGLKSLAQMDVKRSAYYGQVRCAAAKIASATEAFARSPAGPNIVVIVHGDHGSRMTKRMTPFNQSRTKFEDQDLIAVYSTFFAIRAPEISPEYSTDRRPVATLLRDFTISGFRTGTTTSPPKTPEVFLTDGDWKVVEKIPLPASWTKGVDRPATGQ